MFIYNIYILLLSNPVIIIFHIIYLFLENNIKTLESYISEYFLKNV